MPSHRNIPPSFSIKLIRFLCKSEWREELEGNLYEFYDQLSAEEGHWKMIKYWYEVINYLRPSTLKTLKLKITTPMFIFNPRITIRNLLRHPSSTLISLFGFTIGLISVIFLFFYIENEMNYDAFHVDKDKIYRIKRLSQGNSGAYDIGVTSGPFAAALLNDFPDLVQSANRVYPQNGLVTYEDEAFYEEKMIFTDSEFFEFFSFPLITGNPSKVLSLPNSVVISKPVAHKYFGSKDPIGKVITVDNEYQFTVTGVLGSFPNKSHIDFDMVFPIQMFEKMDGFNNWWSNRLITYVKVNTSEEAAYLNQQLPSFMEKYFGEDFKRSGNPIGLAAEPLDAVYFNNIIKFDPAKHGNKASLLVLGLAALAILLIACFNYVNLSIAQSYKRFKEIGIRKVMGVNRGRLLLQFLGESFMVTMSAIVVAIALSTIGRPLLNNFFALEVSFDWTRVNVVYFFLLLLSGIILTSGIYPALLMSSFKPLIALKGKKPRIGKSLLARKSLVITQFALSIFLIIATMLITSQLNFVKNKEQGYDQNAIMLIDLNSDEIYEKREAFKEALRESPNVLNVTSISGEPGGFHDAIMLHIPGVEDNQRVRTVFTDPDYLKTFGINVVAGRGFDTNIINDSEDAIMVNQMALKAIGLPAEELIGSRVQLVGWEMERTVIGVFQDYHFTSLKEQIEPLVAVMGSWHSRIAVKINSNNFSGGLADINRLYAQFSPNFPIHYEYQDDSLARLYMNEDKQAKIFKSFSGVSLFLACLGIFGLAIYAARQRQKELGIRKILGASIQQIIRIISKEFLLMIGIASLLAIPLAWYFMERWLEDFAYRINLSEHWMIFLVGGIIAGIIAFLTIYVITYKAAVQKPTESIKCE